MDHMHNVVIMNELYLVSVKFFHAARFELTDGDVLVSNLAVKFFICKSEQLLESTEYWRVVTNKDSFN